jgi:hypothetical protein
MIISFKHNGLETFPLTWISGFKRHSMGAWVLVLVAAMALSSCTSPRATGYREVRSNSADGESVMACDLLYFGLATPRGEVTEAQWQSFLDEIVTPRFPAGLTSWEAKGQWRGQDGSLVRERSKVLQIVHPPSREGEAALGEIIAEYKRRFQQESVMRIWTVVDVSF